MKSHREAYESIIRSIDWKKIKSYHKKLDIYWEIQDDKQSVKIIPTIEELKNDLRSIFEHMLSENLFYISHGNWIIFWDREPHQEIGDIRIIFRLADFVYEEDKDSYESLQRSLEFAIENEDYEYAAVIRDEMIKKAPHK